MANATTGLLLVDHGSPRAEANARLDDIAALVTDLAGADVVVATAHMELCEPSIATAFGTLVAQGIETVRVMPYFLGPGRHVTQDIPRLVREAAADHPNVDVSISEPLGIHPDLARLVLHRAGLPVAGVASPNG
ncbi:MAG: CbiX/SirB N-terminal domain-containing protein [Myxococcota bacterium]